MTQMIIHENKSRWWFMLDYFTGCEKRAAHGAFICLNHELLNAFFSFWISLVKVNVGLGFSHRHLNRAWAHTGCYWLPCVSFITIDLSSQTKKEGVISGKTGLGHRNSTTLKNNEGKSFVVSVSCILTKNSQRRRSILGKYRLISEG